MSAGGRSRRELVRNGVGAVVAIGAAPLLARPGQAIAAPAGDAALLREAIALEQRAVIAYEAIAKSGKLGDSRVLARLFGEQEQEHADGLARALRDRGGSPPAPPEDVPGLRKALAGGTGEIIAFAMELETMALAGYYDAQARLRAPELIATTASIMANEAQHLTLLRQALGREPVPDAFESGRLRPGLP